MARYRHKSQDDLSWNRTRREITSALDNALRNWREERLNELLFAAWEEHAAALKRGEVMEVAPRYKRLAREVVRDLDRAVPLELPHGNVVSG